MSERRNRLGVQYALNVFTQIVHGHERAVRECIEGLEWGEQSPWAQLDGLHFARLQIFDELVNQGASQRPDRLKSAYLVFTCTFDGELDPFLDAICTRIPAAADSWWGHCLGYPGSAHREEFRTYMRHNKIDNALFSTPYADADVDQIRTALTVRDDLVHFAASAQGLDAQTLQQRFLATFGESAR